MADTEKQQGQHPDARKLAETVATGQAAEATEMQDLLGTL